MSDIEAYLTRCYSMIFGGSDQAAPKDSYEVCACATMINHSERRNKQPMKKRS